VFCHKLCPIKGHHPEQRRMACIDPAEKLHGAIERLIGDYNELNPNRIDELNEEPTPLEFMRYVAKNRPFIIRKGAADWPACLKWDGKYLRRTLGDTNVKVALTPYGLVFDRDIKSKFQKHSETTGMRILP
jgi:hypothetical protein